jgi:hypothetical protein
MKAIGSYASLCVGGISMVVTFTYQTSTCASRMFLSFYHTLLSLTLTSSYNPGDVVIFRSPYLFHAISKWVPGPMMSPDKCTPGRVSWVHFTHADVHEKLKDKPKGFFRNGGWLGVGVTAQHDEDLVHVF